MGGLGDLFSAALGAGKSMLGDAANSAPIVPGNPMLNDLAQGNRLGALNIGMTGAAGALAAGRVAQGAYNTAATLPAVMDSFAQGGGTAPITQGQVAGVSDLASLFGGASAPIPKPAGSLGIFGGRNALTADIGQLDEASALRSLRGMPGYENVDKDTMLQDTGWFRGLDGKDRFEISDHASTLRPGIAAASTVGQALDHPDLYAAYPHLADIEFVPGIYREGYGGSYMPGKNQIALNMAQSPKDQRGTLLHELQHAVQQREGFAPGSSPSILQNGLSDYMQTAGEVEARAAQARADMTPEQRRAAGVWTEEQLPEAKHQILYPWEKGQFYSQYAERNPVSLAYEPSISKHTDDELLAAIMNKMAAEGNSAQASYSPLTELGKMFVSPK